ncbi:MAG: hypothetical protein A2848_00165 [Candidatus Magasanikbacteria bacterium RIFCSPHIGHO2_01_FULL_50_8]|uniref:Nudix hydrolase domain-containing protein n=1 Tax=Candidatus Magasanikbacteria bacterium RIFCSPHIGHO2_01_FULL_50_8 TaxID=1798674 RepID=A0A1F6LVW0_9BACT|nr:MAG: hypothetical protein A2848_00165 [Candidatus Magasanikbacteria bacterium RIFCSPHIGHO2_01_FULL_50_8]
MNREPKAYELDSFFKITRIDHGLEQGDVLPDRRSVAYANAPYLIVTERDEPNGKKITWVQTGPGAHIFPLRLNEKAEWEVGLLLQSERYDALQPESGTEPPPKGLGGYVQPNELVLEAMHRIAREKVGMQLDTQTLQIISMPRFMPIGTVDVQIVHRACVGFVEKAFPGNHNCRLKYYTLRGAVNLAANNYVFDAATADGIHKLAHWITTREAHAMRQKLREEATRKRRREP